MGKPGSGSGGGNGAGSRGGKVLARDQNWDQDQDSEERLELCSLTRPADGSDNRLWSSLISSLQGSA